MDPLSQALHEEGLQILLKQFSPGTIPIEAAPYARSARSTYFRAGRWRKDDDGNSTFEALQVQVFPTVDLKSVAAVKSFLAAIKPRIVYAAQSDHLQKCLGTILLPEGLGIVSRRYNPIDATPLDQRQMFQVLRDVAIGLRDFHRTSGGGFHGRLCLSDVLMDSEDGHAVIRTALGEDLEPMTDEIALFQSPEALAAAGPLSQATDVFSFACIAVALLSGRRSPYAFINLGDRVAKLREALLIQQAPPDVPLNLPSELRRVLQKALSIQVEGRAAIGELITVLSPLAKAPETPARSPLPGLASEEKVRRLEAEVASIKTELETVRTATSPSPMVTGAPPSPAPSHRTFLVSSPGQDDLPALAPQPAPLAVSLPPSTATPPPRDDAAVDCLLKRIEALEAAQQQVGGPAAPTSAHSPSHSAVDVTAFEARVRQSVLASLEEIIAARVKEAVAAAIPIDAVPLGASAKKEESATAAASATREEVQSLREDLRALEDRLNFISDAVNSNFQRLDVRSKETRSAVEQAIRLKESLVGDVEASIAKGAAALDSRFEASARGLREEFNLVSDLMTAKHEDLVHRVGKISDRYDEAARSGREARALLEGRVKAQNADLLSLQLAMVRVTERLAQLETPQPPKMPSYDHAHSTAPLEVSALTPLPTEGDEAGGPSQPSARSAVAHEEQMHGQETSTAIAFFRSAHHEQPTPSRSPSAAPGPSPAHRSPVVPALALDRVVPAEARTASELVPGQLSGLVNSIERLTEDVASLTTDQAAVREKMDRLEAQVASVPPPAPSTEPPMSVVTALPKDVLSDALLPFNVALADLKDKVARLEATSSLLSLPTTTSETPGPAPQLAAQPPDLSEIHQRVAGETAAALVEVRDQLVRLVESRAPAGAISQLQDEVLHVASTLQELGNAQTAALEDLRKALLQSDQAGTRLERQLELVQQDAALALETRSDLETLQQQVDTLKELVGLLRDDVNGGSDSGFLEPGQLGGSGQGTLHTEPSLKFSASGLSGAKEGGDGAPQSDQQLRDTDSGMADPLSLSMSMNQSINMDLAPLPSSQVIAPPPPPPHRSPIVEVPISPIATKDASPAAPSEKRISPPRTFPPSTSQQRQPLASTRSFSRSPSILSTTGRTSSSRSAQPQQPPFVVGSSSSFRSRIAASGSRYNQAASAQLAGGSYKVYSAPVDGEKTEKTIYTPPLTLRRESTPLSTSPSMARREIRGNVEFQALLLAAQNVAATAFGGPAEEEDVLYGAKIKDGRSCPPYIAVANIPAMSATVLDAKTGDRLNEPLNGHSGSVRQVALVMQGEGALTRLVTASEDGTAKIWDWASGKCLASTPMHPFPLNAVATCAADPSICVTAANRTARVIDWNLGIVLNEIDHPSPVLLLALEPFKTESKLLATASADRIVRVYDWKNNQIIAKHAVKATPTCIAFSEHHYGILAIASHEVEPVIFDSLQNRVRTILSGHMDPSPAVTWHRKYSHLIATGSFDGNVHLWDWTVPHLVGKIEVGEPILSVAFSPFNAWGISTTSVHVGSELSSRVRYFELDRKTVVETDGMREDYEIEEQARLSRGIGNVEDM